MPYITAINEMFISASTGIDIELCDWFRELRFDRLQMGLVSDYVVQKRNRDGRKGTS
jgi:hypothetical protein